MNTLKEALRQLEKAAREDGDHLKDLLDNGFDSLKNFLKENAPDWEELKDKVQAEKVKARVDEGLREVDESAHKNPWLFVMVAALIALFLGMMFSKRK